MATSHPPSLLNRLSTVVWSVGLLIGIMWCLEATDRLIPALNLEQYGIYPRNIQRWYGIFCAPFLHGSWRHLLMNTPPFILFGGLIAFHSLGDLWIVSAIAALISGIGVWVIAPAQTITLGASGVIFGYFGFLLFRGLFERSGVSLFISMIIAVSYGGLIWQVFPTEPHISWQAHLFGFIGGVLAASLYSLPGEPQRSELP
ncbi:MAG: rhomboid family intramembrane serine protease [Leptolyngbyaceae bacterium]|nr:rhomboid family intramembrane serine protease [Leptolyngbyaceae bacterium]